MGSNQFLWIHKKDNIIVIKILWIHKKRKYRQSKFYGSTKKEHTSNQNFVDPQKRVILTIKILWIHKKMHILAIKLLWIHKKPSLCKSQFCGSTKFGQSDSRNFIDPQNHCQNASCRIHAKVISWFCIEWSFQVNMYKIRTQKEHNMYKIRTQKEHNKSSL